LKIVVFLGVTGYIPVVDGRFRKRIRCRSTAGHFFFGVKTSAVFDGGQEARPHRRKSYACNGKTFLYTAHKSVYFYSRVVTGLRQKKKKNPIE